MSRGHWKGAGASVRRFASVGAVLAALGFPAERGPGGLIIEVINTDPNRGSAHVCPVSAGGSFTVTLEVWATVTGQDTIIVDGLQSVGGSFLSANNSTDPSRVAVLGALTAGGLAPFNGSGSSNGTQQDLDGDGDLDVGTNSGATGLFAVRSSSIQYGQVGAPSTSWKIGTLRFDANVATSVKWDANTVVYFRPSTNATGAVWVEDNSVRSIGSGTCAGGPEHGVEFYLMWADGNANATGSPYLVAPGGNLNLAGLSAADSHTTITSRQWYIGGDPNNTVGTTDAATVPWSALSSMGQAGPGPHLVSYRVTAADGSCGIGTVNYTVTSASVHADASLSPASHSEVQSLSFRMIVGRTGTQGATVYNNCQGDPNYQAGLECDAPSLASATPGAWGTPQTPSVVWPGTGQVLVVAFSPPAAGAYSGAYTIRSRDFGAGQEANVLTLNLTGQALECAAPMLSSSGATFRGFAGAIAPPVTFTLRNSAPDANYAGLDLNSVSKEVHLALTGDTTFQNLGPGESKTYTVQPMFGFWPYTGAVTFHTQDDHTIDGAALHPDLTFTLTCIKVYAHSISHVSVLEGDGFRAFVGAAPTATVRLYTGGVPNGYCGVQVEALTPGLSGTTGDVLAPGTSRDFTATINTGTDPGPRTFTESIKAGDDQSVIGANPTAWLPATIHGTVLNHALPSVTVEYQGGYGDRIRMMVDWCGPVGAPVKLTAGGDPGTHSGVQVDAISSLLRGATGDVLPPGTSRVFWLTFDAGSIPGTTVIQAIKAGDDQSIFGAYPTEWIPVTVCGTALAHSVASLDSKHLLTIVEADFGVVSAGSGRWSVPVHLFNLPATEDPAFTAGLALLSVDGSQAGTPFSVDSVAFSTLCAGSGITFNVYLDANADPGSYTGRYVLILGDQQDIPGATGGQLLTLDLTGSVVPEPLSLSLLALAGSAILRARPGARRNGGARRP